MTDSINIYRAGPDDAPDLARLAVLDSQPSPLEPMLVVAVEGQLQAAVPLRGGPPIADPFHHTTQLVTLLELRAAQLRELAPRSRRHRFRSAASSPHAPRAPAGN